MRLACLVRRLAGEDEASITFLGLFLFLACIVIGGLALDVTRAQSVMTQIQSAADAAAHAAVITRSTSTEAKARAVALDIAVRNLPPSWEHSAITSADIEFGDWDPATGTFVPRTGATESVRVTGQLSAARGNALGTFLLRFAGKMSWTIEQDSVIRIADHDCLQEGLIADTDIDIADQNRMAPGFCVHSNDTLKLGTGNVFDAGAIVSMPAPDQIRLPTNGFALNPGLNAALVPNRIKLKLLERIPEIITGLTTPGSDFIPDYIVAPQTIVLTSRTVRATSLIPGRIHRFTCSSTQEMVITSGTLVSNVVIVTNCNINILSGVVLENAVLATTSTSSTSVTAADGVQVGRNDNCAEGGGAQIVTLGGLRLTRALQVYGGQLLAARHVNFIALAQGMQGVSIISGGEIDGGSGVRFRVCNGAGMQDGYAFPATRIVE